MTGIQGVNNSLSDNTVECPNVQEEYGTGINAVTFTVPDNETWRVLYGHIAYDPTGGGVGNRIITVSVLNNAAAPIERADFQAGAVITNVAIVHFALLGGVYRETTVVNGELHLPVPTEFWLPPGWAVKLHDSADIDAVNDAITAFLMVKKLKV